MAAGERRHREEEQWERRHRPSVLATSVATHTRIAARTQAVRVSICTCTKLQIAYPKHLAFLLKSFAIIVRIKITIILLKNYFRP